MINRVCEIASHTFKAKTVRQNSGDCLKHCRLFRFKSFPEVLKPWNFEFLLIMSLNTC